MVTRLFFRWSSFHSLFRGFVIAWGRHPSRHVLAPQGYIWAIILLDISRGSRRQATMTGRQDKEFYWIRLIRLEISHQKITRPWKGKLLGLGSIPSFPVLLAPRISRSHFFFAVFFRVTHGGLSERGTTRSNSCPFPSVLRHTSLKHRFLSFLLLLTTPCLISWVI